MEYSLGITNELNNQIRQNSSSRRQPFYLLKTTEDLERYFAKLKEDYEFKVNELQARLDDCLNYEHLVERYVDCRESRNKKQGLSINLQRYEDLLECNFKEIQWVRSSRMSESNQELKFKKIDSIQAQVNKLEQFIFQRSTQQEKNIKQLQQSVVQELKQIKLNFQERYSKHKENADLKFTQLTYFQQSLSQNLSELDQALKVWDDSSRQILESKIDEIEQELQQLNAKR